MAMNRVLDPLVKRIRLALGRGLIKLVDDEKGIQKIQLALMKNEIRSNLERFQEYGFTSHPHIDAEAAAIFVGGNRDHGIIIAVDDRRYRLKGLDRGEVAIYTDEGDNIILKRDRNIEINTLTLTINAVTETNINTPILNLDGDLSVSGDIDNEGNIESRGDIRDRIVSNPDTIQIMRETFNTHTHVGDSGGTTNVPNQLMGD